MLRSLVAPLVLLTACTKLSPYDCAGRGDCPGDAAAQVDGPGGADAPAAPVDAAPPACGTTAALGPGFELAAWSATTTGAGAECSIASGRATCRIDVADANAGLTTDDTYVFEDSSVTFELLVSPDPATATDWRVGFTVDLPEGAVAFEVLQGDLAVKIGDTFGAVTPYDARDHRFLRLSERSEEFGFETSRDGVDWNQVDRVTSWATLNPGTVQVNVETFADAGLTVSVPSLNPGTPATCE